MRLETAGPHSKALLFGGTTSFDPAAGGFGFGIGPFCDGCDPDCAICEVEDGIGTCVPSCDDPICCQVPTPEPQPTATVTVHFTGSKTTGDNLSFASAVQTCSESLGLLNCTSTKGTWVWNVEVEANVSDDASSWLAEQSASGLEKGFWKGSTGTLHSFSTPISAPNDNPPSSFLQQPSGQKTIFWLDSPGFLDFYPNSGPIDSMTSVLNFTSVVCSDTDTSNCYSVNWFVKIVVKPGGVLDTGNSQAGFGTLSTNF